VTELDVMFFGNVHNMYSGTKKNAVIKINLYRTLLVIWGMIWVDLIQNNDNTKQRASIDMPF
jgi:hypothetical protein